MRGFMLSSLPSSVPSSTTCAAVVKQELEAPISSPPPPPPPLWVPSSPASTTSTTTSASTIHEEGAGSCRECYSTALVTDWSQGDVICTSCGTVAVESILDDRAEWREFNDVDDLAKGKASMARSGLVVVDETSYLGGLQPTTLSKQVFGGKAVGSSSAIRLAATNRKMNAMMERVHNRALQSAKLCLLVRKKKKQQRRDGQDDDDDYEEEEHDEDREQDCRPELEHMLVQEEQDAQRLQAALYAEKWSMTRALQLHGKSHEKPTGSADKEDEETVRDDKKTKSSSSSSRDLYTAYTLLQRAAGRERLQLPERVLQEAVRMLQEFAMRKDGLVVRGVASSLKQPSKPTSKPSQQQPSSLRKRTTIRMRERAQKEEQEKQDVAKQVLREFNKLKQMGSLCSALLFLTARNMGHARVMSEVCQSICLQDEYQERCQHLIMAAAAMAEDDDKNGKKKKKNKQQPNHLLSYSAVAAGLVIKKKHCSKAMNEIKQVFPDFATSSASANGITTLGAATTAPLLPLSNGSHDSPVNTTPNRAVVTKTTTLQQQQQQVEIALQHFVEHTVRKLDLPLVAEASVRCLFLYWQRKIEAEHPVDDDDDVKKNNSSSSSSSSRKKKNKKEAAGASSNDSGSNNGTKMTTLCAALAYFVCVAGDKMQRLAQQSAKQKRKVAAVATTSAPRKRPGTAAVDGGVSANKALSLSRSQSSSSKTNGTVATDLLTLTKASVVEASEPPTKRRKTEENDSDFDDDVGDVFDWTTEGALGDASASATATEPLDLLFMTTEEMPSMEDLTAEQREYEMSRMWDAWVEQMPWSRTAAQVERSCGVSRSVFGEFYRTRLFPRRKTLLDVLKETSTGGGNNSSILEDDGDDANRVPPTQQQADWAGLRGTPMASVLLPHVTVAAPLMKAEINGKTAA